MIRHWISFALAFAGSASALAGSLTYEDLVGRIREKNLRTVDSVLAELPGDYTKFYTLLFGSDSLQYADPLNPRAVVFGLDASLVLAFSCDAADCVAPGGHRLDSAHLFSARDAATFQALEVVQFRPQANRFELFEIHFGDRGPEFSGPNPAKCLTCHGSDPHPIWEHYNNWPKAYGDTSESSLPRNIRNRDLEAYKSSAGERERYRRLPVFGGNTGPEGGPEYNQPNSLLSERFQSLNYRRVIRQALGASDGADYSFVLIGAGESCNLSTFVPAGANAGLYRDYFEELRNYAKFGKIETYGTSTAFNYNSGSNDHMARLLPFFDLKGIATADWPMSQPRGFYASFVTPLNPHALFLGALLKVRPELGTYLVESQPRLPELHEASVRPEFADCQKLADLSREAIGKTRHGGGPFFDKAGASWEKLKSVSPADTYQQCQSCHLSNAAPYLPFDKPQELTQAQLDKTEKLISTEPGPAPVRRMPLRGPFLSEEAQKVFMGYLQFRKRTG